MARCIQLGEPRPLHKGKVAWNMMQARVEFSELPRRLGHRGFLTTVYVFDGLMCDTLGERLRAHHKLFYDVCKDDCGEDAWELQMKESVLVIHCFAHLTSNSLKWATQEYVDQDTLTSVHIVIDSLRRSSRALLEAVDEFMVATIEYNDRGLDLDAESSFWKSLGVDGKDLDMVLVVCPRWTGKQLLVREGLQRDVNGWTKISMVIKFMLRWWQFCDTRWIKVTKACTFFLRSEAIGVSELVRITRKNKTITDFDLHGYAQCSPSVRKYAVVLALSSLPQERFMHKLLDDDRVLLRLDEFEDTLKSSCEEVLARPRLVYERIAPLIAEGVDSDDVQGWVARACLSSVSFVQENALNKCRSYPLKLAVGDVESNLQTLATKMADTIDDPVTGQIHSLLAVGYPLEGLVSDVSLWKQIPFTTNMAEQGHASGSLVLKRHPELGADTMMALSLLHSSRTLFRLSKFDRICAKLIARIQRLNSKNPRKMSGRQVYLGELVKGVIHEASHATSSFKGAQTCMKQHGTLYKQLDVAVRIAYDLDAKDRASAKEHSIANAMKDLELELLTIQAKEHASRKQYGWANHVMSFRFGDVELESLSRLFQSEALSSAALEELRASALESPLVPSDAFVKLLEDVASSLPRAPQIVCPSWCSAVCLYRHMFRGAAFFADGKDDIYLLMYACQSPRFCVFLHLKPSTKPVPNRLDMSVEEFEDLPRLYPRHRFDMYEGISFCTSAALSSLVEDDVFVIFNVRWNGRCFATHGRPEHLNSYLERLPPVRAPRAPAVARRAAMPKHVWEELLREYPWLAMNSGRRKSRAGRMPVERIPGVVAGEDEVSGSSDVSADERPALEDDVLEKVHKELAAHRADWAWNDDTITDFGVTQRGGGYTAKEKGESFDVCFAHPIGGSSNAWCVQYGFPQQKHFTYTCYGEVGSNELAREVCRRAQYFYNLYVADSLESDDPSIPYEYSQYHVDSYAESKEFTDFLSSFPEGHAVLRKVVEVRSCCPRLDA
eukprot:TRINITY_DN19834_c0_g1_i1.p1 TRINITY_DN19834_c0_g1~~TRINITY_DN19834_c0_g1_i1.p1  ORF type:complete len:1127 (+),score=108.08 TRINITY_DN19834_c0_g1_i1:363-3383(+)